jgi:hypothetical protein
MSEIYKPTEQKKVEKTVEEKKISINFNSFCKAMGLDLPNTAVKFEDKYTFATKNGAYTLKVGETVELNGKKYSVENVVANTFDDDKEGQENNVLVKAVSLKEVETGSYYTVGSDNLPSSDTKRESVQREPQVTPYTTHEGAKNAAEKPFKDRIKELEAELTKLRAQNNGNVDKPTQVSGNYTLGE